MKKILLASSLAFFFISSEIKAQGQGSGSASGGSSNANAQWKTTGNTAQTSDFVGTTNQQPLIFKTNNAEAMRIDPTGKLIFSKLTSTNGDGIILVDGGGGGGRIDFTHNFNHVLNGQGIFTDISTFTGLKVSGNNIIQTTSGNIGIGVANPMSKLSVSGGGSFTGDLNIGGNILSNMLTTNTLSVGTLSAGGMTSTSLSTGGINAATLDLSQNLSFNGGTAKIGFTQTTQGGTGWNIISFGPHLTLQNLGCYIPPSPVGTGSTWNNIFGGRIQLYNVDGPGGATSPNNILTFQSDAYGASIDLAGYSTNTGNPNDAIAINYYCGKDVLICNNAANSGGANGRGGVVRMGQSVEIGGPISDYNSALNIRSTTGKALNIQEVGYGSVFSIGGDGCATINSSSGSNSPFVIENSVLPIANKRMLEVDANGKMTLFSSVTSYDAFLILDKSNNNKVNFKVKTNGQVYAREVTVMAALNNFPDYVFADDYKLLPLEQVKKFTETNKRLPNMPSAAEVNKNGANLGEIQRVSVEKIEELYKYIFEMESEIKTLREEIKELKKSK